MPLERGTPAKHPNSVPHTIRLEIGLLELPARQVLLPFDRQFSPNGRTPAAALPEVRTRQLKSGVWYNREVEVVPKGGTIQWPLRTRR
jgi:hypothetical protein